MAIKSYANIPGYGDLHWTDTTNLMVSLNASLKQSSRTVSQNATSFIEAAMRDVEFNVECRVCVYKNTKFIMAMPGNTYYRRQLVYMIMNYKSNGQLVIVPKFDGYDLYQWGELIQSNFHNTDIQAFMNRYILKKLIKETP